MHNKVQFFDRNDEKFQTQALISHHFPPPKLRIKAPVEKRPLIWIKPQKGQESNHYKLERESSSYPGGAEEAEKAWNFGTNNGKQSNGVFFLSSFSIWVVGRVFNSILEKVGKGCYVIVDSDRKEERYTNRREREKNGLKNKTQTHVAAWCTNTSTKLLP